MQKIKPFKQILYLILLVLSVSLVSAANMTIQQLIDSYDYSYSDGALNITSQNDYMLDKNNNGINDTLIINITTDAATAGTYKFIVEIVDKNGILINDTNKSIIASDYSANVDFPSELLSKTKFNYSIRINDNNNNLVFRKTNIESQTYLKYETGTNITRITDENINNNFLRINLTINSTSSATTNVTVTLAYNSSTISKTEEKSLSNGLQVVSIDFDNETIKSTHYTGNFTIDSIVIGNKIFDFNQNTSIYNYEDFAKTSYIKSITDGRIDTNANNLSEFLEINFTVNVKTTDTYNLTYDLYDQFNNFVISINKTQTLALGNQTVQTLTNGSEIYKTKINGPYVISFAKLAIGNDTKDILLNAHTTNQSFYTDYERPPLPDLKVTLSALFNQTSNVTDITVNLSNVGTASAFNVFLDIFDNVTYNNNRSMSFFTEGDKLTYQFNVTNSSNSSLITVIADFDNLVDEINESNNIAQNVAENVSVQADTAPPSYSNLKTSPTSPATYQKNQQYQFNATWQDNSGISKALIEFNGINYTMSQNGNEYYRTFTDLAVGNYNYYFWANDTSGNSNKTNTFTYTINKATPSGSLTNNVSWSINYGKHVSIGFAESNEGDGDLTYKIYRNQTDIGSGEAITLAAGIYQYVLNTTGGQNYSSTPSIDTQTLTVSKAQSSTSLTFDKTSPQTYGTSITPTCSLAIGVGTLTLTMNGTTITSGNPLTLGAGTYQFNCSLAESQNYTSSQNASIFVINQAAPNLTYYLNSLTQNITIQYPQKINASAYATGGAVNIFRNGTTATSENSVNVTLAVGYYRYEFNVTGNQNYTDVSSKFLFASVNKGASIVYTYVNNLRSNATITAGTSIYLNGTLIAGEGPIQLYNNGTLINSGQSPLSNLTTFNNVGPYNVTTIYPETQNYTSSFETWWVNVSETPPAGLTVTSLNAVYSNNTRYNFEFIIRNGGVANLTNINWSLNTGLATISSQQPLNLTSNENTTIFVDFTYNQTGEYNVVATATDGTNQDSESITINIPDLEVMELSVLNSSNRRRVFEFIVKNYLSSSLSNVTWNIKFGDGNNLNNTDIVLQPLENMSVYVDYTYATTNTYVVNASAVNSTLKGYHNITITVT